MVQFQSPQLFRQPGPSWTSFWVWCWWVFGLALPSGPSVAFALQQQPAKRRIHSQPSIPPTWPFQPAADGSHSVGGDTHNRNKLSSFCVPIWQTKKKRSITCKSIKHIPYEQIPGFYSAATTVTPVNDQEDRSSAYLLFGQVLLSHDVHVRPRLLLGVWRFAPCAKEHEQEQKYLH